MTTKITEQNISNLANLGVQWQSVHVADGSTALSVTAGKGYFINTTSGAQTVNLPNTATRGDTIILKDYAGTWGSNAVTISSTLKISGADANGTLDTNNTTVTIVFIDTTKGWMAIQNSTQGALAQDTTYLAATGGTVATSGDFKIHTFTGDGNFVVSQAGTGSGPSVVDYLVIAGGGAGGTWGGGGGGAGGLRESHSTPVSGSYTASPLATPTGITVSAQTYPIVVGGGGAAAPSYPAGGATGGSNSSFSTITSTGGGVGGGTGPGAPATGRNGGSGGGGHCSTCNGGSGNTPPVSPPQGNNGGGGGNSSPNNFFFGGGGGGAGQAGNPARSVPSPGTHDAGPGGNGVTTNITGSPVTYGGGGAGGNVTTGASTGGSGGGGGASPQGSTPTPGTANTGGGGAGAWSPNTTGSSSTASGAGGKGIVILRYKFQN